MENNISSSESGASGETFKRRSATNLSKSLSFLSQSSTNTNTTTNASASKHRSKKKSGVALRKFMSSRKFVSSSKRQAPKALLSMASSIHSLVFSNNIDYKRLQEIERRRRAILTQAEVSFFKALSYWDGTVLQAVFVEPMFWITMLTYIMVRVGAYNGLPTFVSEFGITDTTTVGASLTFFLVLHVNEIIRRFNALYTASMNCQSSIFNTATLACSTLPRGRALRLVRYLNAAHIAGYVGLSNTYTFNNFFLPINESKNLLTKQELDRIGDIDMDEGGAAYREIIVWAMDEVHDALTNGHLSETIAWDYRQFILKFRNELNTLYNYHDQPTPFFITHFAVLMTLVFLPMIAASHALNAGTGDNTYWMKDVVQGVLVFLQAIVMLGLRALSIFLSDPYGDDVHDLSVMHYINSTWTASNRMLAAKSRIGVHHDEEELNFNSAEDIGDAWEDDEEDELDVEQGTTRRTSYMKISNWVEFDQESGKLTGRGSMLGRPSWKHNMSGWVEDDDQSGDPSNVHVRQSCESSMLGTLSEELEADEEQPAILFGRKERSSWKKVGAGVSNMHYSADDDDE